jgi:hypothetical protein
MYVKTNHSVLSLLQNNIWWNCGKRTLLATLPSNWSGTWVLMQLVTPFTQTFHNSTHGDSQQMPQSKRETPGGSFDDSKGIAEQLSATTRKRHCMYHDYNTVLYFYSK